MKRCPRDNNWAKEMLPVAHAKTDSMCLQTGAITEDSGGLALVEHGFVRASCVLS